MRTLGNLFTICTSVHVCTKINVQFKIELDSLPYGLAYICVPVVYIICVQLKCTV